MYFVIYAIEEKEYYTIPKNWIKGLDFDGIVNNVINCSAQYECYCGDDIGAYNDEQLPNVEYVPDFSNRKNIFTAVLMKYYGKCIFNVFFSYCNLQLNLL